MRFNLAAMRSQRSRGEHGLGRRALAVVASVFALAALSSAGCEGPKYPLCDGDTACNTDGHKGVCVQGTCVECRDDVACGTGRACQAGTCADIPNYCDSSHACLGGAPCTNNRCQEIRKEEARVFVECDDTKPCGTGSHCENGHCVTPPNGGPGCTEFSPPHFDYESPDVKGEARATLERLAGCLTKGGLKTAHLLLTGHCDNRGEQEFNMSLGDYRAQAVKGVLVGLGVGTDRIMTSSRGKLDAVGTDEAGWSNDRRVDIEVR
jgi:peptidoglycan-associated lipoprotein